MAWSKTAKPTASWTGVGIPTTVIPAEFDLAEFDNSQFDSTRARVSYTPIAKPIVTYTKVARPTD